MPVHLFLVPTHQDDIAGFSFLVIHTTSLSRTEVRELLSRFIAENYLPPEDGPPVMDDLLNLLDNDDFLASLTAAHPQIERIQHTFIPEMFVETNTTPLNEKDIMLDQVRVDAP